MTDNAACFEIFPEMEQVAAGRKPDTPTGQFRWRFKAGNGAIVATGAEGYSSREHANRAIHGFLNLVAPGPASPDAVPHPPIYDIDEKGNEIRA